MNMGALTKIFLISFFIKCVLCDEALFDSCNHSDIECLRISVDSFFTKTSVGIPELGIKQVEPLTLKYLQYADPGSDIVVHFRNIKITGLKDMKLNNLQMDTDTNIEVFQMKVNINIESNLQVELKEASKFLPGAFRAKATGLATAKFSYAMKPNSNGVEHFNIGPETYTCEDVEVTEIVFDPHFADTVENDPEVVTERAHYQKRLAEIKKQAACTIIAEASKIVFFNIRAAAKAFPKTAFFTDL